MHFVSETELSLLLYSFVVVGGVRSMPPPAISISLPTLPMSDSDISAPSVDCAYYCPQVAAASQ